MAVNKKESDAVTYVTFLDYESHVPHMAADLKVFIKSYGDREVSPVISKQDNHVKLKSAWVSYHIPKQQFETTTYNAVKVPSVGCHMDREWGEWNADFIRLLSGVRSDLENDIVSFAVIRNIAAHVPDGYSLKSRLENIESEVSQDENEIYEVNVKSFLNMLRFMPVLQEKQRNIGFYMNETKRFGITLGEGGAGKKTLDLLFKENGEVYFSYMDMDEGISRISGSSYLTDYLSNSKKVRKIFNLFDY